MKSSPVTAVPAVAAQKAAESDDTHEIREQIERTREDMGRTIDELQERLSPQNVVQQAKDSVHDATVGRVKEMVSTAGETARDAAADVAERAQDTASMIADEVRSHPVTTALIGAGIVWLLSSTSMFRRRSYEAEGDDPYDWEEDDMSRRARRVGGTGPGAADADGPITYRTASFQGDDDMANGYGQGGWTDVLRDHPVPTALAALGIGYLVMQRDSGGRASEPGRGNRKQSMRTRPGMWDEENRARQQTRGYGDAAHAAASDAREAVGEIGEKVSEWGGQLSDGVRSAGAQARETAGEFTENVQERWQTARRRTSSEFEEWMDENPLAVGAAALAAGLALGFSTPRTRFEDEHIGPTRDALVERTSEAAEDAAQDVKERVKVAAAGFVGDESSSSSSSDASSSSSARQASASDPSATSGQSGRAGHNPVF
jgi:ElaB/YqjD/DUF883 family membrane-anchored ribosome-binding protein